MTYAVERDTSYDFLNESYATSYPNLHRYPATMLPQIGIKLLNDFDVKAGNMLDPYCGSGSSFTSGLEYRFPLMEGYDINPLAVMISKAKFTRIDLDAMEREETRLRRTIKKNPGRLDVTNITNANFWFSRKAMKSISALRNGIYQIKSEAIRNLFLIPFSETVRECSYTRNNEFKLYRMKEQDMLNFNPDVFSIYFDKLSSAIATYSEFYLPKLTGENVIDLNHATFKPNGRCYDAVLTSPPYGDSRTTVAYGQFSTLSNEWLGVSHARKIDGMLMGGQKTDRLYDDGIITDCIRGVAKSDHKRALEVSSFYRDLEGSINKVAGSVKKGGKVFYIVGNRIVKNVQLPTDQFIAEKFENNGFKHITTIKRALSNKTMPSKNSPTNKKGKTVNTMAFEYLVVCQKVG